MKANVWLVMQKRLSLKDYDYVVGEIDKELSKVRKQTLEEVLEEIEIEREQRIKNKQVDYGKYISAMEILATFEIRIREMLEQKIKELKEASK